MKHPNLQKVIELATTFDLLHKAYGLPVDIHQCDVKSTDEELCRTPACHAGWFGVALDGGKRVNYNEYAYEMAKFLGFKHRGALEDWADNFPEIWGNDFGSDMFSDNIAFGKYRDEKLTLKDVSNHWFGVAKRMTVMLEKQREEIDKALGVV
jgi:hypothetical protein